MSDEREKRQASLRAIATEVLDENNCSTSWDIAFAEDVLAELDASKQLRTVALGVLEELYGEHSAEVLALLLTHDYTGPQLPLVGWNGSGYYHLVKPKGSGDV